MSEIENMRDKRRIRVAATVGAAAVALTATAGCSAARDTADAVGKADSIARILARVTSQTEKIGSAKVDMSTDLGQGSPVTMKGTYSWGKGAAYDVMMDTAAARMQQLQDDPELRALLVDGAYYYNVDPQPAGPLKGKHWLRVDVSAVLGKAGAAAVEKGADPTAGLRYIGLTKDVEDLGEQSIRGREAHHYRATLDKSRLGGMGKALSPSEEKNIFNSVTGPVDKITIEVWVDGKDLPVRMVQVLGKAKVTIDFLKFGGTRAVTAPPASDTADLSSQLSSQKQG
ncbi:hypothetical protein [Actinacidiphila sp. bgisy160]|uniref:hypothetical protein n=1 Tax=Actinacidiphila sp. bgisy160 TaxID=3413796 RepID=UPI003D717CEF